MMVWTLFLFPDVYHYIGILFGLFCLLYAKREGAFRALGNVSWGIKAMVCLSLLLCCFYVWPSIALLVFTTEIVRRVQQ